MPCELGGNTAHLSLARHSVHCSFSAVLAGLDPSARAFHRYSTITICACDTGPKPKARRTRAAASSTRRRARATQMRSFPFFLAESAASTSSAAASARSIAALLRRRGSDGSRICSHWSLASFLPCVAKRFSMKVLLLWHGMHTHCQLFACPLRALPSWEWAGR